MLTFPLKSHVILPEQDLKKAILQVLKRNREGLKNEDILVVTSKIISLSQGRLVLLDPLRRLRSPVSSSQILNSFFKVQSTADSVHKNFMKLVGEEAEIVLRGLQIPLTIKNGVFIPQAGIDFSNAQRGFAILWPEKPWDVARDLWKFLKKKFGLQKLGMIISDSHCQPLRWGTTGLALAFAGFFGVSDVRGKKDIFGKKLKITKIAVADNLASSALLEMGEADERIPFVIIRDANVEFSSKRFSKKDVSIKPKDCLFAPLYPKTWKS